MRNIYYRLNRRTESPPHSAISTANARRKIPTDGKSNKRKAPMRKKGNAQGQGVERRGSRFSCWGWFVSNSGLSFALQEADRVIPQFFAPLGSGCVNQTGELPGQGLY